MSARSFRLARQIKLRLRELPYVPPRPTCPTCGEQQALLSHSAHTRQCERDRASQCLEAIGRKLLALRAAPPSAQRDREIHRLREERHRAWRIIMGFDALDRGRVRTSEPGYPDDGLPI